MIATSKQDHLQTVSEFYAGFGDQGMFGEELWTVWIAAVGSKEFSIMAPHKRQNMLDLYKMLVQFHAAAYPLLKEEIMNYRMYKKGKKLFSNPS